MILLPAIDIRGGRAVRLRQGDFDDETVYVDDPLDAAHAWARAGARALHVVDLDGARAGEPRGIAHLERIAGAVGVPVQYGGGLRTADAVERALAAGAARAVVGTAALRDARFLRSLLARFDDRVTVALDARDGEVAVAGWTEGTGRPARVAAERLAQDGVTRLVYTDVDRDGMLAGPDVYGLRAVAQAGGPGIEIIYSGGVGSLDDLRALGTAGVDALTGVISGKALYERRFTVAEGQAALDEAAALH